MTSPARFLGLFACLALQAADPIQSLTLDPRAVVTVPVATNRVTTLSFPVAISALDASGVTLDPKVKGLFHLAHTRGSSFLSLRALAPQASANLNVRLQGVTYVFELQESSSPVLCLNLVAVVAPTTSPAPRLAPAQLLGLLDRAKAYPLLHEQHPDAVRGIQFRPATNTTDFGDFAIQLEEVLRFEAEDSLVFRALITNRADSPLRYAPDSFRVRAGNRLYPQSVSEASGQVPPHGASPVYLAITGSPDGGRAELSLHNEFSVHVTRLSAPPALSPPAQESP